MSKAQGQTSSFLPAMHSPWLISLAQNYLRLDLAMNNRVRIDKEDLEILAKIPLETGIILTPNHADETDPRLCIDLSRRAGRRMVLMCNREAFSEIFGIAGWGLQRLGYFSVERGGHDAHAKRYAVDAVAAGNDIMVIFPEGEIFYLNDSLQPFHSGAVDIGMRALADRRQDNPYWTALIVPLAIKYRYIKPIDAALEKRVRQMECRLSLVSSGHAIRNRLGAIQDELLDRQEKAYQVQSTSGKRSERVGEVRHAIFDKIAQKHTNIYRAQARTIDRAWQLGAHVRKKMSNASDDIQAEFNNDLAALNEVAHLASWKPEYIEHNPSQERLAEVIMKLEREVYNTRRPRQLGPREVFLRIGEPIDLSDYLADYQLDPHAIRHHLAETLRDTIQSLIDSTIPVPGKKRR